MGDRGIGGWFDGRARISRDRVALIHGEWQCTYGELATRVRRLAHGLRGLGVERGDRVAWIGANHPAFLEVLFATAQLGAVMTPVNHRLDPRLAGEVLAGYSPAVVVVEQQAIEIPLAPSVGTRVIVGASTTPDVDYEQLLAADDDRVVGDVDVDDVCMIPHTSGTTGSPKGVMLTHGNITWNVVNLLSVTDFRGDDITIAITPFFRTGGTGVNVLPVLFKGGTVVIPAAPDPDEILRLIEEHRVTIGFGNPDLLDALTRAPRWPAVDLSSIRCYITGGAPVPERLIRTFMQRGVTFLQGYGLSEAAPVVLLLDPECALGKMGSAGRPPPLVDVRTVRPDGAECAPGETGELLVQGPNVMPGYWNDPDATRAAIDDEGWLRTGDAARIDDDGFVWIVDRVADAYEVSGRIVFPGDVERVLAEHPAVREAGVVELRGEGVAVVVLIDGRSASEDELLEFCRSRLATDVVPSSVVFVDELPRSSVGKLLRADVRALAATVASHDSRSA